MTDKEHKLQVACINWFRYKYPKLKYNLFAIPNGSARNIVVAKKLKAEGVLSGVFDVFLAFPNKEYHGLFLELKIKPNKPTLNQIKFAEEMIKPGYQCKFIYSFDEFEETINTWLK